MQVPQFEGLVLGGGDQQRLHRVEGQAAHRVKVAPQGELGVPALPQRLRVVGDLEGGGEGGGGGAKRINREDTRPTLLLCLSIYSFIFLAGSKRQLDKNPDSCRG